MFASYNAWPLSAERIPEAFPVIAVQDDRVTAQQWASYAGAVVAETGHGNHGIMTLQDPQGHIVGLAIYHIRPDLQRGRVLVIENFAVASLTGAQQAAESLLAAMERLARDRGCECLAVSLLNRVEPRPPVGRRSQIGRLFKGAGYELDRARLSKCFVGTALRESGSTERVGPYEGGRSRP